MTFEEALKAMREGKTVTKPGGGEYYIEENEIIFNLPSYSFRAAVTLGSEFLLANDWEVCE
ncbi:MAG: DUF2829 domain-containing protein [Lactobacillales bacterium]|jgi:hypothetical protein|nr:DUF2829 domain-containing protein [Lactobacillales bacterium]